MVDRNQKPEYRGQRLEVKGLPPKSMPRTRYGVSIGGRRPAPEGINRGSDVRISLSSPLTSHLSPLASVFLLLTSCVSLSFASYQKLSSIMHVHSNFSHGVTQSIAQIASKAAGNRIDVIFLTDHDSIEFVYKPFELFGVFSKKIEFESIKRCGPENYLIEIINAQRKYPEVLIISGVEASAYHYWSGSFQKGNLTINDWHKHLLILGMDKPEHFREIPTIGVSPPSYFNIFLLWPVILLVYGIAGLARKKLARKKMGYALLMLLGIVFFVGNYPFRSLRYDPNKKMGSPKPYQGLIDWSNKNNLLTIWAHPESTKWQEARRLGAVHAKTEPYTEILKETNNYSGFAIFPEGYRTVGSVGGIWDQLLNEYCDGVRDKPVWAVSELDYEEDYTVRIDSLKNILLATEKSQEAAMEAMRLGRFYAVMRSADWGMILNDFYLKIGSSKAIYGETMAIKDSSAKLFMDIRTSDAKFRNAKIYLIKNGELLNVVETQIPNKIYIPDSTPFKSKNYYRVFIDAGYPNYLATNPVFVKTENGGER